MKKGLFILVLFVMLFHGCEKIMHPENQSSVRITSKSELSDAAAGVYGLLAEYFKTYKNSIIKGDDLNIEVSSITETTDGRVCVRNSKYATDDYSWEQLYKIVISINSILSQLDDISLLDYEMAGTAAEIYFLRGYCYFRLTRLFGAIPLIKDIDIKYDVPKTPVAEIYSFIENDVLTAIKYLPKNNLNARLPFITPHRGVAKAFLAELYLTWGGYPANDVTKYSLAAKTAGEVIDSSSFFGFRLMDDFANVWNNNNLYNEESVFSIYYPNIANYKMLSFEGCYYGKIVLEKYLVEHFLEYQFNPDILLQFPQVEINFYNNYPQSYRKEVTFFTNKFIFQYYKNNNEPVGYYIHHNYIDICNFVGYQKFFYNPALLNYDDKEDYLNTYYYTGSPRVYIYRYAQTLLTYAEAKSHIGQLDASAYIAVNMIRRRANNVNIYSPSDFDIQTGLSTANFTDSVVLERAWELCGEPEGRWFDLVRLEKVEDFPLTRDVREGGPPQYPITKEDYYFPIPKAELDLNPILKN